MTVFFEVIYGVGYQARTVVFYQCAGLASCPDIIIAPLKNYIGVTAQAHCLGDSVAGSVYLDLAGVAKTYPESAFFVKHE